MNHELIMLRELKRMYKLSQSLAKEARYRAIKSHSSFNVANGTMGQISEICRLIQLRDDCLRFCIAANDAFNAMEDDKRRLLKRYYVKGVDVGAIADSLKISRANVYNKLYMARTQLKNVLNKFGYTEQWLRDNYAHFDFIAARL